jgi:acyl-CoA thioesterase FadM
MSATEIAHVATGLEVRLRPRYEGSNIRTWIGFKHLMYAVEEAVLEWFRARGEGPQALYHQHGLGLEIVDSSAQLPALVEIDDELVCRVQPRRPGQYTVTLHVARAGADVLALRGKVEMALVEDVPPADAAALATDLRDLVSTARALPVHVPDEPATSLAAGGGGAPFTWTWTARYFHCHYSDRVQHSAYVRALEEVVDRFLAARGMSIRTMLEQRGWIPVVSRARVRMLACAHMEERIVTTFRVTEVLRNTAFDGTMECHVERDGRLVRVASAQILHGYAASRGPNAGRLVDLDERVIARLLGPGI